MALMRTWDVGSLDHLLDVAITVILRKMEEPIRAFAYASERLCSCSLERLVVYNIERLSKKCRRSLRVTLAGLEACPVESPALKPGSELDALLQQSLPLWIYLGKLFCN